MNLTVKQRMFVAEYLKDNNGTQAAIRAGYAANSAEVTACKLLRLAKIQEAINEHLKYQEKRTLVTADYVINGIKKIADNGERESDKLKAYELLGKHLKLFTDKTELTGKDDGEIRIKVNLVDD